eukprot:gnl/Trimastix_PCT/3302.p1 GENE.gnl/Trimastix_PCT/3302~~gnl/Trimastix_PCT/3302.p1  ORF type:complete len:1021 (+),score=277.50 gnl/Trimastix_PCT/3302:75-3137(+)
MSIDRVVQEIKWPIYDYQPIQQKPVGRGGFGVTFLVKYKQDPHTKLILKLIPVANQYSMAVDEQQMLRRLGCVHPDFFPQLIDAFPWRVGDKSYYVLIMSFIEGDNLWTLRYRRKIEFDESRTIDFLQQMTRILAALQEMNTVHRDIKPANIILDARGRYYLVDMGLCRERSMGKTRQLAGTPHFTAPEVLIDGNFSFASDVYSVAKTAHFMLQRNALGDRLRPILQGMVKYYPDERFTLDRLFVELGMREAAASTCAPDTPDTPDTNTAAGTNTSPPPPPPPLPPPPPSNPTPPPALAPAPVSAPLSSPQMPSPPHSAHTHPQPSMHSHTSHQDESEIKTSHDPTPPQSSSSSTHPRLTSTPPSLGEALVPSLNTSSPSPPHSTQQEEHTPPSTQMPEKGSVVAASHPSSARSVSVKVGGTTEAQQSISVSSAVMNSSDLQSVVHHLDPRPDFPVNDRLLRDLDILPTDLAPDPQRAERPLLDVNTYSYSAAAIRSGSAVAVRYLTLRQPSAVHEYKRELLMLRRYTSPSIVTVHGGHFDPDRGDCYIVTEQLHPLSRFLHEVQERGAQLTLKEIVSIARDACRALTHLMEQGITHRSLQIDDFWISPMFGIKTDNIGLREVLQASGSLPQQSKRVKPPEAIVGPVPSQPSGVYHFGILLCELAGQGVPSKKDTDDADLYLRTEEATALEMLRKAPRYKEQSLTKALRLRMAYFSRAAKQHRELISILLPMLSLTPASRPPFATVLQDLERLCSAPVCRNCKVPNRDAFVAARLERFTPERPLPLLVPASERLSMQGSQLLDSDASEAQQCFERAASMDPNNIRALLGMGVASNRLGHRQLTISYTQAALHLEEHPEAHTSLGIALSSLKRHAEATSHLERAVQMRSDSASAHFFLGASLLKTGRPGESPTHFERALELDPSAATHVHTKWGMALLRLGDHEQAIEHLAQAAELDPESGKVQFVWGCAMREKGEPIEAIQHLQLALDLRYSGKKVHNALGQVFLDMGVTDVAQEHFDRA